MAVRKALYRLAFLILLIPVGLLLTLHFFGENRLEIPVLGTLSECEIPSRNYLLLSGDSLSRQQENQLSRVDKQLARKGLMPVQTDLKACLGDTIALLLVDKSKEIRGMYHLEQSDINRLFAELDILIMNDSYGEGVVR